MDVCAGACEHGDPEYDSDNDPLEYDGGECTCTPCKNFDVCQTWCGTAVCAGCKVDFGAEPLEATGAQMCPVCREDVVCLRHPAKCGHCICATCLSRSLAHRCDLPKPGDYGFARDCACEDAAAEWGTASCGDCEAALERWENTDAGEAWVDDCIEAEGRGLACPLCRTHPHD